jgi:hypothetical protein
MADLSHLVEDLKRSRDEIRLQIHLGSKEAQDEWSALERRWQDFEREAQLDRSTKDVRDAVGILGAELKEAYGRVRKAL